MFVWLTKKNFHPLSADVSYGLFLRLLLSMDALHEFILSEAVQIAWVPGSFPWGDRLASSQHRGTIHVPRAGVPSCTFGSAARAE